MRPFVVVCLQNETRWVYPREDLKLNKRTKKIYVKFIAENNEVKSSLIDSPGTSLFGFSLLRQKESCLKNSAHIQHQQNILSKYF